MQLLNLNNFHFEIIFYFELTIQYGFFGKFGYLGTKEKLILTFSIIESDCRYKNYEMAKCPTITDNLYPQ